MFHRRTRDTEAMDRVRLWAVQSQVQWRSISIELSQADTEDDQPVFLKEVEAAVL